MVKKDTEQNIKAYRYMSGTQALKHCKRVATMTTLGYVLSNLLQFATLIQAPLFGLFITLRGKIAGQLRGNF